jgi:endoglucanase
MKRFTMILCFFWGAFQLHAALLVDNCETGTLYNSIGSAYSVFQDGYSSITFTTNDTTSYAGTYCRRMDWTLRAGNVNGVYVGVTQGLNSGWLGMNLSAYAGIRFYAKGTGAYNVAIGIDQTRAVGNHYVASVNPDSSWVLYEIPFTFLSQGWGPAVPWDPSTIYSVGFNAVGMAGNSGQLYVDNIEFYTAAEAHAVPDPNIIILQPKVNQAGYLLNESKYFCVVTNTASAGDTYRVLDASNNTVYSGTISGSPVNDIAVTGEGVWKVDFSAFNVPGTYYVTVNGLSSYNFTVSNNAYDNLFRDSLRCFYLIRCGLGFNDPLTGLNRLACHTAPDTIRGGTGTRDMSGGWHNAGDVGKWANEEAISIGFMLWLYELKSNHLSGFNNNIRESGNGISDLLNEAKWGLDWMLKLQNPDGSVYHKSDTEPNFCWGTKPDQDPYTRYVAYQKMDQPQTPSSIDAAVFTAVMAQASRVYAAVLPAYSATCAQAAVLSWNWLKNHRGIGQTDPYYTDAQSWQEEEWAMGEIFRLTGDASVSSLFDTDTNSHSLDAISWTTPEFFGYFTLMKDSNTSVALKSKISARITVLCDSLVSATSGNGYGTDLLTSEYYWESNEALMDKACCLLMGYSMTGNEAYKTAALGQLGYMLGNNSLNKAFVTREGTNYASHPYNWTFYDYGILIPGWASGGPNEFAGGAGGDMPLIALINEGTPPAKCWLDMAASNGSYASNEGETSENAALVFLSGYFFSTVYPDTPTPTSTSTTVPTYTATPTVIIPAATYTSTSTAGAATSTNSFTATSTSTQTYTNTPTATPMTGVPGATGKISAYPVPCDLRTEAQGITLFNLPLRSILDIYSMSGELVHRSVQASPDGRYFWKLKNLRKDIQAAQGIYIYLVFDGTKEIGRGKLVIIR